MPQGKLDDYDSTLVAVTGHRYAPDPMLPDSSVNEWQLFVKLVHTERATGKENPDCFWTVTFVDMHREFCEGVALEENLMVKYALDLGNKCAAGLAVKIARAVSKTPHELFPEAPVPVPNKKNPKARQQHEQQNTPVRERTTMQVVGNTCGTKHNKFNTKHYMRIAGSNYAYQFEEGEKYGNAQCAGCATRFGKTERMGVKRVGARKNAVMLCQECELGKSNCCHCWCIPCWEVQVAKYQSPIASGRESRRSQRERAEKSNDNTKRVLDYSC